MGVKRLTGDELHVRIVEIISDKGMTDIFHMNTDLMGTACFENERDKAVPVFFFYHAVVGDRVFPVFLIDLPLDQGSPCPSDGRADRTLRRCDAASHYGEIFSCDFVAYCHAGKDTGTDHVLGDHGQTGGVPVQTVCTPEDERLSLLIIIMHKRVRKGIPVIVKRRMGGHPCWLVDDDQILVLVNDIQGEICRRDVGRGLVFLNVYREHVSLRERSSHIGPGPVDKNALGHFFELGQVLVGISLSA